MSRVMLNVMAVFILLLKMSIPHSSSAQTTDTEQAKVIVLFNASPVARYRSQLSGSALHEYHRRLIDEHMRFMIQAQAAGLNLTLQREFTYLLNGLALVLPSEQVDRLGKQPGIRGVYPDMVVHVQVNESVPLVGAPQIWEQFDSLGQAVTGSGVNVAVIDTGIDYTHSDLGGCLGDGCKVIGGYDFQNNDADPIDDNGHGTHCAGIVAADGILHGVAPGASLIAYKVLAANGTGNVSTIIAGIERAADPDQDPATDDAVDIISMSLGLPGTPDDPWPLAVDAAVDQGILVVTAAGNTGPEYTTIDSPGLARKAFAVAASDKTDQIAFFSARGPVPGYEDLFKPEITAPGVAILSTWLGSTYATLNGTSMATPHVAGASALLLQMHPGWSPEMIKANLMNTAFDIELNPRTQGAGRLQVDKAAAALAVATPGGISFGLVDTRLSVWSAQRTISLTNISSSTQSFTVSAENSLTSGVVVTVSPTSLALASGATANITLSLSIQPALVPPDLDRNSGRVIIRAGTSQLVVPFIYTVPPFFELNREFSATLQTTYAVALQDLNGDGDLDAFFGNTTYYDHPANTVWFNDGSGIFSDSGQHLGNSFTWDVVLGDLDGDGDPDAFVANSDLEAGQPDEIWLNNGHGVFSDSGQRLGNSLSRGAALGDLDHDGDLDVFVANGITERGRGEADLVWFNDGHGNFSDSGQRIGTSASQDVALGDIDSDGDLDAFVACGDPLRLRAEASKIWFNNGHGVFSLSSQVLESVISQDVALGDLDEDGDLDAFVANGGPGYGDGQPDRVWLNNGQGIFTDSGQRLGSLSSYGVVVGDVDADGHLDAFVAGYQGGNKVWLNDGIGHLTDSAPGFADESAVAAALGDVDSDGDLDAVLANAIGQENKLWLNRGNQASPFVPVAAPTNLTAVVFSQTQVNLAWNDNAIDETEYRLERSPDGITSWTQVTALPVGSIRYSDTPLTCNTPYYYRVRAYRAGDEILSSYSNVASVVTSLCNVAPPSSLTAVSVSQSQIDLTWHDAAIDETEFIIERSDNGETGWAQQAILPAGSENYSDSGLACGKRYYYRARAYRSLDARYSDYSNEANETTMLCNLVSPGNLTATPVSQIQINLAWLDNAGDESAYSIERSLDGVTGWVQFAVLPAETETYNDSALSCATYYYYRVRAFRDIDGMYSAYSNITGAVTTECVVPPPSVVSAPSNLMADTVSQTQIALAWQDNALDENEYRVERSFDGLSGWVQQAILPAGTQSYNDSGLGCGTVYYFRVRAYRASDTLFSPYSNIASNWTKLCTVSAPGNLSAVSASQTQIDLAWEYFAEDETDIRIERSPDGITGWAQIQTLLAGSENFSDTGLACNIRNYYRVRAYRSTDGQYSAYSLVANATTKLCDVAPPSMFSAIHVSQTENDLVWEDNATDESEYRIERSTAEFGSWMQLIALPAQSTNYRDINLACGTNYYYRVYAYRASDSQASTYSNAVSSKTLSCPALHEIFFYIPLIYKEVSSGP